jgi:hypothetical protein
MSTGWLMKKFRSKKARDSKSTWKVIDPNQVEQLLIKSGRKKVASFDKTLSYIQ